MRFISLNAWGGQEWPALSDWIASQDFDILCLQEMIRAPVPSPDWLAYRDPYRKLDQRADLFGDVSRLLPQYQARFAPAARGTLSDHKGHAVASEHGIAFWVHPALAITEAAQHFIHGRFRPDGWGAEPVPRSFQIARVCDTQSGSSFSFAHLHGLRDPAGKDDTLARKSQCAALIAAISGFCHKNEPLILAGDFNLAPDSATFTALNDIGLKDLVTTRGHKDTRTSLYTKVPKYADYLLVTRQIAVQAFDVPSQPEVSDHRMMVLDFAPTTGARK